MRRRAQLLAALVVAGAGLLIAGCGDSGPNAIERQQIGVEEAGSLCEEHGGVAYLNFDQAAYIDELGCGDGYAPIVKGGD